jgi:hypothetical protein
MQDLITFLVLRMYFFYKKLYLLKVLSSTAFGPLL